MVGELVGELLRLVEVLLAVLADRHLREAEVEVEAAWADARLHTTVRLSAAASPTEGWTRNFCGI